MLHKKNAASHPHHTLIKHSSSEKGYKYNMRNYFQEKLFSCQSSFSIWYIQHLLYIYIYTKNVEFHIVELFFLVNYLPIHLYNCFKCNGCFAIYSILEDRGAITNKICKREMNEEKIIYNKWIFHTKVVYWDKQRCSHKQNVDAHLSFDCRWGHRYQCFESDGRV